MQDGTTSKILLNYNPCKGRSVNALDSNAVYTQMATDIHLCTESKINKLFVSMGKQQEVLFQFMKHASFVQYKMAKTSSSIHHKVIYFDITHWRV